MYRRLSALVIVLLGISSLAFCQIKVHNHFNQHYFFQERLVKGLVFDIVQDSFGLMWFATEYGLVRYDGHSVKTFSHEPDNPNSLAGNVVTALAEDGQGNLWVGTQNSGLHYFDRNQDKFYRFQNDPSGQNSLSNNKISKILVEDENSIWITTEGGGVNLLNLDTGLFSTFPMQPPAPSAYALLGDKKGQIWVGDYYGLCMWDPSQGQLERRAETHAPHLDFNSLKTLAYDHEGSLWAGFRNGGLKQVSTEKGEFSNITTEPAWPAGKNNGNIWEILPAKHGNIIVGTDGGLFHLNRKPGDSTYILSEYLLTEERRYLSLYRSRDGVLWLGTNNGVVVLAPRNKLFQVLAPRHAGEITDNERGISTMTKEGSSLLWIGTIDGIWQFDLGSRKFHRDFLRQFPVLRPIADENISVLYKDSRGKLWIAVIKGFNTGFGLYQFDPRTNQLQDHSDKHPFLHSYPFRDIHEDPSGNIWLASHGGLIRFDQEKGQFSLVQAIDDEGLKLQNQRINVIHGFEQNRLLLGTNFNGFYIYEPESNQLSRYSPLVDQQKTTINPRVIEFASTENNIWIGTAGGLFYWDHKTGTLEGFDKRHGLADNVVKTILVDQPSQTWIGTQRALTRWDKATNSFTSYVKGDGMEMQEFWDRAGHVGQDGTFYFGGDDGLLIFHPDSVQDNKFPPPIAFTQFDLFNRPVSPGIEKTILSKSLVARPIIYLEHRQNVFTIHYAALSYINPGRNQYAVKMEGFQEDWQIMGTETEATYTNLNPGTYYFRVKAANNDGVWNNESPPLTIVVAPPWYRTWWAITTYLALTFLAIMFVYRFQLQRKLAQVEAKRLKELDLVKTELYTHITHEFRTPLSLIQGPVERAINDVQYQLGRKELTIIRNNCKRLLKLIQQILNLNRLEANALELHPGYGDLVPPVKFLVDAFSSFARSLNIELQFSAEPEEILLDFDPEGISDILSNLLLNACKYTAAHGKVKVEISQLGGKAYICVEDTGRGIPPEELDHIFDHFYRVRRFEEMDRSEVFRSGTGIGLSTAKRLVELMEGELSVVSQLGVGSCFTLALPIKEEFKHRPINDFNVTPYVPQLPIETYSQDQTIAPDSPQILVVDDNIEMANFIANCLPKHFMVTLAYDGNEGIKVAQENIPDLIISDVMMPQIDGFQLTECLKQDIKTSHIPIVLLTARSNLNDRLQGLKTGGEVYLTKPFHQQELLIQVENLLDNRRRLQQYYLNQTGLQTTPIPTTYQKQKEDKFLQKVRTLIEEKISDSSYSVEGLAKELHLSTSQLYRKMMALTGQSTSKFFRNVQLKKAIALLENSDFNISEIAYQSGFNEPAYFSRVFIAEYGISPSQYRENKIQPSE
ncbi:MAG: response regulator [Cyanothece sp. SIO1E1]|nr:response regulator [Cyanothece sp. SIO1E1]